MSPKMNSFIIYLFVFTIVSTCSSQALNRQKHCECRAKVNPRITGVGESVDDNSFPWMVSIGRLPDTPWDEQPNVYKSTKGQNRLNLDPGYMKQTHMCGGFLISDQYVLTAAHCVYRDNQLLKANQIGVGFGTNLVQIYMDGRYDVSQIITHEKFERVGKGLGEYSRHDIALIKLKKPVDLDKTPYRPACLTSESSMKSGEGVMTAVGFGGVRAVQMDKSLYEKGHRPSVELSTTLKQIQLVDISPNHKMCALNKHLLCTQPLSKKGSLCLGDSGSPLHSIKKGRFGVSGISSFSDERVEGSQVWVCDQNSMFTKIADHIDWIRKHIANDYCEF